VSDTNAPLLPNDPTSTTLIGRLRQSPRDEGAWKEFDGKYGEQMRRWCRHWGLQPADADDVTQRVLLDLSQQMSEFVYDRSKSFRAWLKTIAHRAWQKYVAALRRPGHGSGDSDMVRLLSTVEARDDLAARLDREFDLELLEGAMAAVQARVEPATWEAFRLLALEKLSGEEAARALGVSVDAAFKAKSNVTKRLREEMKRLENGG
jgi:RNA polymerase sigma-70 factor (ECF subfamily)